MNKQHKPACMAKSHMDENVDFTDAEFGALYKQMTHWRSIAHRASAKVKYMKKRSKKNKARKPSAILSVLTDVVKTLSAELQNEIAKHKQIKQQYAALERSHETIIRLCNNKDEEIKRLTKTIDAMNTKTPQAAPSAAARCLGINMISGHRCIREAGHPGLHYFTTLVPNETKLQE